MAEKQKIEDEIKSMIESLKTGIRQKFINRKNLSNTKISFIIAFVYVGLGTIYSYYAWTDKNPIMLNETLGNVLFYIFLPSSFISTMILFTEREPNFLVLITQTVTFFIIWAIVCGLTSMLRNKK